MSTDTKGYIYPFVKIGKIIYQRYLVNDECCENNCGDCGAPLGTIHHFGCDCEHCPSCGDQFAFCDCKKTLLKKSN
jgi:hypothetical protein